jgi:7,8-dihydropterin-6-yl-methyl-4-(beta-D-ribofuranosyl)aminobenzene 5'-phosphate synthase
MKLCILTDNNAFDYVLSEFGLSIYLEIDKKKILFDMGFSDIFIKNAKKLGIDLFDIDYAVFSHGHPDHTWGLSHYIQNLMEKIELKQKINKPSIVCCPETLKPKWLISGYQYSNMINRETIDSFFTVKETLTPLWITKNLVFLGKIKRTISFEKNVYRENVPKTKIRIDGKMQEDKLFEDSAIACKTKKGLVIITGCSHSGICNIIEYAKKVCKEERVYDVIGGFHLVNANENHLENVCKYIKKQNIKHLHMCHCTDLKAKIKLSKASSNYETGAGLFLHY